METYQPDFLPFTPLQKQEQDTNESPSPSNLLLRKYGVVILALVTIPLFPSQAPDFLKPQILPQLWELFHLLFIGIVVCYALLVKKSEATAEGGHSRPYSTIDASHSYLSSISDMSSFFEFQDINPLSHDAYHNRPLGLPVRRLKHSSGMVSATGRSSDLVDVRDIVPFNPSDQRDAESCRKVMPLAALEYDEQQEFNGQYRSTTSYKSNNSSKASSPSRYYSHQIQNSLEKGDQMMDGHLLLEYSSQQPTVISDYRDAAESSSERSSPTPRQVAAEDEDDDEFNEFMMTNSNNYNSSSGEMREAPLGLGGESNHGHIRSWSFWRPAPLEPNPTSSFPTKASSSAPPHPPNVKIDDDRIEEKDVYKSRSLSSSSSSSDNGEEAAKSFLPSSDVPGKNEGTVDSSSSFSSSLLIDKRIQSLYSSHEKTPSVRRKGPLMGKSVRTIRSRGLVDDDRRLSSMTLDSITEGGNGEDTPLINTQRGSKVGVSPIQESTFVAGKQNGIKEDSSVMGDILESRDDSVSVWNNSDASSDSGSCFVDDVELGSEVDRKADEFIAKFKEQIRLQKIV